MPADSSSVVAIPLYASELAAVTAVRRFHSPTLLTAASATVVSGTGRSRLAVVEAPFTMLWFNWGATLTWSRKVVWSRFEGSRFVNVSVAELDVGTNESVVNA